MWNESMVDFTGNYMTRIKVELRDAKAAVGEAKSGLKQLTTKISHSEI